LKDTASRVRISPSIIATDLTTIGVDAAGYNPAVVDLLHVDVMDGSFVPNLTIGPGFVKSLAAHTDIPLDVHLMIERPELSVESYLALNPEIVTIHYESTRFPARLMRLIRERGAVPGVSINPATPVESVFDILPYAGLVLVMSVDPGFYGQSFMPEALRRIERLAKFLSANGLDGSVDIQVDGGINADTIAAVVRAGARIVVAGAAAFKGGDVNAAVAELKRRAIS